MAHRVFRRSVTAGIAFAGAGAIAFSTVPVLPSEHVIAAPRAAVTHAEPLPRVVTTEVEYVALVRSLELLVAGAAAAIEESLGAFSDQMPALFRQVQAQWADPALTPWNHSMIAAALLTPLAPLVVGPFTDAVAEALAQTFPGRGDEIRENLPQAVDYAFARLVGPIISAIGATGAVHQQIYEAGMAGNAPGQWLALLRSPFTVADGFLNGGYGDISALLTGEVGGERIAAPGLLTPWGQFPVDRNVAEDGDADPDQAALRVEVDTVATLVADEMTALPEDVDTVASAGEATEEPTENTGVSPVSDVTEVDDADSETDTDTEADEPAEKAEPADVKVKGEKADKAEKADESDKIAETDTADKTAGTETGGDAE